MVETEKVEIKKLVLVRVGPGDIWTDDITLDGIDFKNRPAQPLQNGSRTFKSLTLGLEFVFQITKQVEYHLSAFAGQVFTVSTDEVELPPPPPPVKFNLYGEY